MQPVNRGGGADLAQVAAADGPTVHPRGPARGQPAQHRAAGDRGHAEEDPGQSAAGLEGERDGVKEGRDWLFCSLVDVHIS